MIRKFFIFALCTCLCIVIFGYLIIKDSKYFDTYQSVIQRKYDLLINTDEPKIIIVAGSSAGFGIDADYLENMTGYRVVNLGLHAGFGNLFNTEIMKKNVNNGDIIILAYEYTLYEDCFENLGDIQLILSGIDNRIDMYSIFSIKNYPQIIGHLFTAFPKDKFRRTTNASGVYSSSSFDTKGNMILDRKETFSLLPDQYEIITDNSLKITDANEKYLIKLKEYIDQCVS